MAVKLKEAMQEPCTPVRVDVPNSLNKSIEAFQEARKEYIRKKAGRNYGGYLRKPDIIVLFMLRVKAALDKETENYKAMSEKLD